MDTVTYYEHWEPILTCFQEFKLILQTDEAKFSVCDSLAKKLEAAHNTQEVISRQNQLTQELRVSSTRSSSRTGHLRPLERSRGSTGTLHRP